MVKPIPSLKKPTAPLPVDAMAAFVSGEREMSPLPALAPPLDLASSAEEIAPQKPVATTPEPSATVHKIDGGKGAAPRRPKTPAKSGRRLEVRSDGSVSRKVTVYLAPELDKQLSIHAVTNDVDRSEVVAEALARYLGKAS